MLGLELGQDPVEHEMKMRAVRAKDQAGSSYRFYVKSKQTEPVLIELLW